MEAREIELQIIDELFRKVPQQNRCEHLRRDEAGPYCGKDHPQIGKIFETRRMVCDVLSLQRFCLDPEGHKKCIYYRGIIC